jgi:integrin beta 1
MLLRTVSCLLVVCIAVVLAAQKKRDTKPNHCADQKTCGGCVSAGQHCGWCMQDGFDADNKARCDFVENLISNGCDDSFINRPDHNFTANQNKTVRNAEHGDDAIQLAPQELSITLRPNKPFKFDLTFRQAENYPVDLYYVMDLSQSMAEDKAKLAELGDLLASEMQDITSDFRLGFGSFVDKKTMPYVSIVPRNLIAPCTHCAAPYGFKNQLRLTDDPSQFKTEVLKANISGNLDAPEGGFDAIMQAIVCSDEIGWRKTSRKMLVYSSDASFHFAGDGKLGGIVTPNDGECHLDKEGYYSESLYQDYPSVSQLSHKIAEMKVNVIFAVTKSQLDVYRKLAAFIEGSTVGELANDSSNVVDLVKQNYRQISSTVEMKTEGADDVSVYFKTKCNGTELRDTAMCSGLGIGANVSFEVSVEVTKCPKDRTMWNKTFSIYPVGLTEKLKMNLDLICECECELEQHEERFSEKCNKSGTFECGACTCDSGRYGKQCECDGSNLDSEDYDLACRKTNTSDVCESHGTCVCGSCDCSPITPGDSSKRYSGKFCGCDDYSCDYYDNQLCGGNGRGRCECGGCTCNQGYNGTACECPISNEGCRAKPAPGQAEGLICNGKGTCKCGGCECNLDTFYRGRTCEDCPTCSGQCDANKACVQCSAFQSGPHSPEYCKANCSSSIELVDTIEDEPLLRKMCQFRDDDDCMFYFAYEYKYDRILVQRTKECPEPVNVLAIVLGVVLGIVLVGLFLLLIWKLFTTIHDQREFAKFEKERQNAKWDTGENPIYKQATSTFKNPMYAGKQ